MIPRMLALAALAIAFSAGSGVGRAAERHSFPIPEPVYSEPDLTRGQARSLAHPRGTVFLTFAKDGGGTVVLEWDVFTGRVLRRITFGSALVDATKIARESDRLYVLSRAHDTGEVSYAQSGTKLTRPIVTVLGRGDEPRIDVRGGRAVVAWLEPHTVGYSSVQAAGAVRVHAFDPATPDARSTTLLFRRGEQDNVVPYVRLAHGGVCVLVPGEPARLVLLDWGSLAVRAEVETGLGSLSIVRGDLIFGDGIVLTKLGPRLRSLAGDVHTCARGVCGSSVAEDASGALLTSAGYLATRGWSFDPTPLLRGGSGGSWHLLDGTPIFVVSSDKQPRAWVEWTEL